MSGLYRKVKHVNKYLDTVLWFLMSDGFHCRLSFLTEGIEVKIWLCIYCFVSIWKCYKHVRIESHLKLLMYSVVKWVYQCKMEEKRRNVTHIKGTLEVEHRCLKKWEDALQWTCDTILDVNFRKNKFQRQVLKRS